MFSIILVTDLYKGPEKRGCLNAERRPARFTIALMMVPQAESILDASADDMTRGASYSVVRGYFKAAYDLVYRLQTYLHRFYVSHRGAYSVEQVQAFDAYRRQTPFWRVIWICVALPLGPLVAAIALECVPLQDPSLGWKANYGMYIRNLIMCIITGSGICIQTKQLIPTLSISTFKIFFISTVTGVITNALLLLIAALWAFPIPFGYVVAPVPNTGVLALLFVFAIGRKQLKEQPNLIGELQRQSVIILVQVMLCIVYPVFNAIYLRLKPNEQTAFIFTLPLIKFVMQNVVAWSTSHLVEFMPGVTLFSVEVFNALYLAKCMQNASSRVTYLVIMAVDLLKMLLNFYSLHGKASRMAQLMQRSQLPPDATRSLAFTVLALCQQPAVLSSRGSMIKLRSSQAHLWESKPNVSVLKQGQKKRLTPLGKIVPVENDFVTVSESLRDVKHSKPTGNRQVLPTDMKHSIEPTDENTGTESLALTPGEKREFAHDALKILFHCEYHLLVEYIEFMIPFMYSVYLAVLFHLPTAAYYPETKNMTSHQLTTSVTNIATYACLELISFVGMHFALKRKFGFSPAYLVAFVIENRFTELQARLIVWFPYVLGLTIEHLGVLKWHMTTLRLTIRVCFRDRSDSSVCMDEK